MKAKEYLSRVFVLKKKIESRQKQLDYWKTNIPYSSPVITDIPRTTGCIKSLVEENAIRIVDLENDIAAMMAEMVRIRKEAGNLIASINDPQSETLLEIRYLSCSSWDETASLLGLSIRSVFRLHSHALNLCDAILGRKEKK